MSNIIPFPIQRDPRQKAKGARKAKPVEAANVLRIFPPNVRRHPSSRQKK